MFWRKKKRDNAAKKAALLMESVRFVIGLQLKLSGEKLQSLVSNHFVMGYIWGAHDAGVQISGITDQTQSLATISVSYHGLFDEGLFLSETIQVAAPFFKKSLSLRNDDIFAKGLLIGGQDMVEFLRDKKTPLGLLDHLKEIGKKESKN